MLPPGVAVVHRGDMDPIQLALDSFPDKRLVFATICLLYMDRPLMVGRLSPLV